MAKCAICGRGEGKGRNVCESCYEVLKKYGVQIVSIKPKKESDRGEDQKG